MKLFKILVSTAVLAAYSASSTLAADIFVIGGKPDDPFWSIVKRGAEDAGKVV
ncbi:MAG: sugar ABC transporter substrate-binding protein, partial [Mesorhizobium sp.]